MASGSNDNANTNPNLPKKPELTKGQFVERIYRMLVKVKTRLEERVVDLEEVIESIQWIFGILDEATSPPAGDPFALRTFHAQAPEHFDKWWSAGLLADTYGARDAQSLRMIFGQTSGLRSPMVLKLLQLFHETIKISFYTTI